LDAGSGADLATQGGAGGTAAWLVREESLKDAEPIKWCAVEAVLKQHEKEEGRRDQG